MSLRIIKAGILDTVQDLGRYGFQHLGINPGGVMDRFAAQAANMLVGNSADEAVIEIHFPSSIFLFGQEAMIALAGADFSASVNGDDIPLWQPVIIAKNSLLQFQKWKKGARCYVAIKEKLKIEKWLNSYSTNIKAAAGGFEGRSLQKDDVISFRETSDYNNFLHEKDFVALSWKAETIWNEKATDIIAIIPGNEWGLLTPGSKDKFLKQSFIVSSVADRMGYRLQGTLKAKIEGELISSGVSFGTVQLLPNGELIILMADHQTTGGYPRIAHVVSAHLPLVAQKQTSDKISFRLSDQPEAEDYFLKQQQHLLQLQNACKFRLEEFFNADHRSQL